MSEARPSGVLRCVTLNLWGLEEPLAPRLRLVEEGLRALDPDVIGLQEVREIPGSVPNQAETLADKLGLHCAFAAATPFGGGHEGLAILSKHAMLEQSAVELPHARPDDRRILISARLNHPTAPVWVHTTHLHYRLHAGKEREDQVVAIDDEVNERKQGSDAPQIVMGDFNARPESDEMRFMVGLTTLAGRRTFFQDAWAALHPTEPGFTWARSNPFTARLAFLTRDRRLDYILVTPERRDGRGVIRRCEIVLSEPDAEGVRPSDHYGVMADVQVAPGGLQLPVVQS